MFKFNDKYIEKVSMLGEINEINDELFYLIFQPRNNYGAKVRIQDNGIDISIMLIKNYQPLVMDTDINKRFYNLTETEALNILSRQFGEF